MKRKYLALLMVLALVLCLFPVTALAAPGVRIAAARTLPKTDAEAAPAAESGDEPEDPAAADEPRVGITASGRSFLIGTDSIQETSLGLYGQYTTKRACRQAADSFPLICR